MIERFTGQLPVWARRDHPLMRYELRRSLSGPLRHWSMLQRLGLLGMVGLLLVAGYLIATGGMTRVPGQNIVESANNIFYFPLIGMQLLLQITAFLLNANVVGDEMRRRSWDSLRATESGAELALRTRWAAAFYRVRWLLALILALRVLLILGLLWELMAFQGRYLDLLINGITPEVPLALAILLLALMLTAALLLPVTGMGLDASLGLLISSLVQQRTFSTLTQVMLILVRIGITGGLMLLASQFALGQLALSDAGAWTLMFAYGAGGDWGLSFLYLGRYGEIWATVPYGIFLGLGLMLFALLQSVLADRILLLAVRRSQQID